MRTMQNFQLLTNCDDLKLKLVLTKKTDHFNLISTATNHNNSHFTVRSIIR